MGVLERVSRTELSFVFCRQFVELFQPDQVVLEFVMTIQYYFELVMYDIDITGLVVPGG